MVDAIQATVGDEFICRGTVQMHEIGTEQNLEQIPPGSVLVSFKNMQTLSDTEKIIMLTKALVVLRDAGYKPQVSLTYLSRITKRFESWPCIWVTP